MPRRIVVTEYVSLDGVAEDPVGMEGSGLGDWTGPFSRGPEGDRFKHDELFAAGAVLLGRVTYDAFAAVWPGVTDTTGFAARINGMPKFVASNSLPEAAWGNTTVLAGDAVARVRALKDAGGGDLLVYGSLRLAGALLREGLVDAMNLMVYPTVLGRGARLFPEGFDGRFRLDECRALGGGIVLLRYAADGRAA